MDDIVVSNEAAIIRNRLEKARALERCGLEPYSGRFERSGTLAEIRQRYQAGGIEGVVKAAGRIMARRGHGKSTFFDLHDGSARLQANATFDGLGEEAYRLFQELFDIGDIVGVSGTVGATRTGEVTIFTSDIKMLAKSLRPLPEKFHGLKDIELRHRKRYLDLVANPEVAGHFRTRSLIIRRIRQMLDERGYLEVDTPILQPIPGGAAARPFVTHHNALDLDLYLRVSPELYLKKLLVGGMERVYEIGRNFRNEGVSPRHNPEFTMLELYQAYGDLSDMMELAETMLSTLALELRGALAMEHSGCRIDFKPPWPRLEFMGELQKSLGVDPWDETALRQAARQAGIEEAAFTGSDLLDEIWSKLVEPGIAGPVFVTKHPVGMSPLCRSHPQDRRLADRFEVICSGMEIANAYSELIDPMEQRKRLEEQAARRMRLLEAARARGLPAPEFSTEDLVDEDFLEALEHGMPPAGGLGLGIDRLAMLLSGQANVREVILFPLLRPSGEQP